MTTTAGLLLRSYLALHVLLAVAYLSSVLLHRARVFGPAPMLRLARALFAGAFVLAIVAPALPAEAPYEPPVQVWFATSARSPAAAPAVSSVFAGAAPRAVSELAASPIALGLGALVLAAALASCVGVLVARRRLAAVVAETSPWKRVGRVELRVASEGRGPFSAFLDGRAVVVLDEATLLDEARPIALAHELQHHRQGDTRLALPIRALLALVAIRPVARGWLRLFEALEEHACDAAVLARGRISVRDYGECLLRAASRSHAAPAALAALLTPRARRALLTRRES